MTTCQITCGDCLTELRKLPAESVQCCVTSPPYWGLRDYGVAGQLGLESTPQEYVAKLVEIFREVRRVLRKDGVLWLNLGDSYAGSGKGAWDNKNGGQKEVYIPDSDSPQTEIPKVPFGLKPKDLVGIPWRVAFALQADGWWLRQDIIWAKPNPMPESVTDRCTKAHEYIFLLSKTASYYYDAEAVKEAVTGNSHPRGDGVNPKAKYKMPDGWDTGPGAHGSFHRNGREKGKTPGQNSRIHIDRDPAHAKTASHPKQNESFSAAVRGLVDNRNLRSVWNVATEPFRDAHFATFPTEIARRCILAGSKPGDTILDPFAGSGTTGEVAQELGRHAVLIELNPKYCELIRRRTAQTGMVLA